MTPRHAVSALVALCGSAAPAVAQSSAPAAPLSDSAKTAYVALFVGLRDSMDLVAARMWEFRRDLRTVGDGTVVDRSGRLATACTGARAALIGARPAIDRAPVSTRRAGARDTLRTAMNDLVRVLEQDCTRGLGPRGSGLWADSLRAWGPHRTAQLSRAITVYHGAVSRFQSAIGIRLPVGAARR